MKRRKRGGGGKRVHAVLSRLCMDARTCSSSSSFQVFLQPPPSRMRCHSFFSLLGTATPSGKQLIMDPWDGSGARPQPDQGTGALGHVFFCFFLFCNNSCYCYRKGSGQEPPSVKSSKSSAGRSSHLVVTTPRLGRGTLRNELKTPVPGIYSTVL